MKKLAIVGTHPRTRENAPWYDPDYDIWVFNESPKNEWVKRWDADFQLHKPEVYTSRNNFVRADHWDWLQERRGKPIYMQEMDERVPDCVKYPLDEIIASLPGAHLRWWKSSPAYAIALALHQGYREIALYGLDMSSGTEYGYQLPNFQYWVGVALGMWATILELSNEQYFTGALYAYEGEIQIPRSYFAERAELHRPALKSARWEVSKMQDRFKEATGLSGSPAKASQLLSQLEDLVLAAAQISGALVSSEEYAGRDDPIPRQEFERAAATAQRDTEQKRKDGWVAHGEAQYVWNAWNQSGSDAARKQFIEFVTKALNLLDEAGVRMGVYLENIEYLKQVDELITAAGGERTVKALEGS